MNSRSVCHPKLRIAPTPPALIQLNSQRVVQNFIDPEKLPARSKAVYLIWCLNVTCCYLLLCMVSSCVVTGITAYSAFCLFHKNSRNSYTFICFLFRLFKIENK